MLGKLRNVLPAVGSTIYVFERKDTLMEMLTTLAMLAAAFTLTMSLAACGASVDATDAADQGDRLEVSDEEVRHPETQKGPSLAENMLANRSGENRRYLQQALEAGADIIMLDNMEHDEMLEAVRLIDGKAEIEISGNVTAERIPEIRDLKVDFISSGALTHSAPILDVSLKNLHPVDR
jgi:DNA-binding NarL/FixJ family response regulator